jgi:3-dehydroquinate dehydratase/shikimate dehydrogenase
MEELQDLYHVERINADTRVFGVIGDPVAHSLSPLVHNVAFRKAGLNKVYVPFRVPREDLEQFVKDFDRLPVQGYSVTIPHKENAATLARVKDTTVAQTQAANTLLRQLVDGTVHWSGFNTDFTGAIDSLLAHLPAVEGMASPLQAKAALILGAGGVARSIAYALQRESGGLLTISGRTHEKAQRLADELNARAVDWNARHSVKAELVVNCTPVGMHPKVDESPLHPSYLKPGLTVFDTVYTPETTLLVKEARQRGCLVVTGVDFFVRQAAHQFRLFTGQEPPLELMVKVVKRALSPVTVRDAAD